MFIPLSVPNLGQLEKEYVLDAVESEWVSTSGSYINIFEKMFALYLNIDESVALQSGSAALHLSLKLCDVSFNDEVIVPTLTFIAAVNPVKYLGASPIFMDCDDSLNMDLEKLESFCANNCIVTNKGLFNKKTRKIIKAVVVVHVFGNMINMEKLMFLSEKYNFKVVEDATEALGTYCTKGKYKDKFAGTIGHFGAYSFNGNKIITTGGGGMLVSNDKKLLNKARYLSTQAKDDETYYIHNDIGYNYRMTNLQGALGVAQLIKIEEFINIKTQNYNFYKEEINNIEGLNLLNFNEDCRSNHWFYSLYVDEVKYGKNKDKLLDELKSKNIQTRPVWGLIHNQKPYVNYQTYQIEKAINYANNILNLPCSTNIDKEQILYVLSNLKN